MTIRFMVNLTDAPQSVVRGTLMRFNMLRPVNEVHVTMAEFCAALEKCPAEWKRQSRNALRAHYGLPQDPVDMLGPIN
jgi:hypothetical protein